MTIVTLRSLWAHKRRLIGTLLAIFLGVAFLSGTEALSDTLKANFAAGFATANATTAAVVQSTTDLAPRTPAFIPGTLLALVQAVPAVASAEPVLTAAGEILGADGQPVGGLGPPRTAGSWEKDPALNPYHLVAGRAPVADNDVVIDAGAASSGGLHVGDTAMVRLPQPVPVRIVGIADYGSQPSFGGETFVAFTLAGAQKHLVGGRDLVSSIAVRAAPGVSQDQVAARIQPVLPAGVEAITGTRLSAADLAEIGTEWLNQLRTYLLVFALIALLVATFTINNTFTVLVAQRSRESALLRALGATRAQVLRAVLAEAAATGVAASGAGLVGGIGIAAGLKTLFSGFGISLPAGGLVLRPASLAVAVAVGIVVTMVAAVVPALRASRLAPLSALRETAIERVAVPQVRVVAGAIVAAAGAALVVAAVAAHSTGALAWAGLGALGVLGGVITLGPAVSGPVVAVLGAPAAKLRGASGALARDNARRSPRRTSATAAALLVGVGVVTIFTLYAASLQHSATADMTAELRADLVVTEGGVENAGLTPALAGQLSNLPQVALASGLGTGNAVVGTTGEPVSVVDPAAFARLATLGPVSGALDRLGPTQLAVSQLTAQKKHWTLGSAVPVTFPDGYRQTMTVGAIYRYRELAGDFVLPQATWTPHAAQSVDSLILVDARPGTSVAAAQAAVAAATAGLGRPTVDTEGGYVAAAGQRAALFLGLVYVMLALAIVIALLGIANTLSLAIHERTRELGLLRAIGQTRAQLRSMVRWEAVTIAGLGTVGGVAVGLFLGWALVSAASTAEGGGIAFSLAPLQLAIIVMAGSLAGAVAATRPARRAARLDVLAAIATE
ncbi:MAG: FtsX-like permease family protein [Acidimicrobiales bacterium]